MPAGPSPNRRPALPREFVAAHKQRRIMDALAQLTAERSYEATKISDVVKRAGVARKTLYENFEGKEEIFLQAFDAACEDAFDRVETACAEAGDGWQQQVEAGLAAFLDYVAAEPVLAHMCMIEALSATPATTRRYEAAMDRFVKMARAVLPRDERLPDLLDETLIGGVAWIVYRAIRREQAQSAADLLPELTGFVIGPYLDAGLAEPRA